MSSHRRRTKWGVAGVKGYVWKSRKRWIAQNFLEAIAKDPLCREKKVAFTILTRQDYYALESKPMFANEFISKIFEKCELFGWRINRAEYRTWWNVPELGVHDLVRVWIEPRAAGK